MSRAAPRRGPASLRDRWRFQLLALEVQLSADSELRNDIEFLAHCATQSFTATDTAHYDVRAEGVDWLISLDGAPLGRLPGRDAAADELFARVTSHALGLMPAYTLLHGALGSYHGQRFLLLGDHLAGLTALSVRLLYRGASIEGDAFTLLGSDGVIALPRRFCLRFGARELLPEVADLLDGLPSRADGAGGTIWAFDPARAGFDWQLEHGPVDACVLVEPNHGGRSMLTAMPRYEMAGAIINRCTPPAAGGRGWVRQATALADRGACFKLQLGQLDDAVDLLRSAG